jgi:hypothetical protein
MFAGQQNGAPTCWLQLSPVGASSISSTSVGLESI